MVTNIMRHVTWNDVVTFCLNTREPPKEVSNIYCWTLFNTPDNSDYPFDRDAFFEYLMYECGDFEAISAHVELLLTRLEAWTKSRLRYWQRIYDVLCIDYNPIYNYNRNDEEQTETLRKTDTTFTDNILDKVAGYDSGDLVENNNRDENGEQNELRDEGFERTNHSYGNIGVMSTQQMIEQEIELCRHSMYDIMLQEFKSTFCLAIY